LNYKKYRGNLHFMCRWVDGLARHPRILDAVEDLLGPAFCFTPAAFYQVAAKRRHRGVASRFDVFRATPV
jgi:hypothetical protein